MSKELEDRFGNFAMRVRDFCQNCKWDIINREYVGQLIRSSGSIGANYIEASDSLGKADELMKLKISRREGKESIHWITLILVYENTQLETDRHGLINEAQEINKILSSIINKVSH
jgi:four helix bundle protein